MKLKLKFILIALCPVFGVIFLTFFFFKAANQVIVPVIIASVIISLVMVAIILLISRGMLKQFDTVDRAISTLSKKDFSLDIENNMSSDSFSLINNINKMIDEINDFFVIVKTTTSRAISSGYMINDSANSTAAATSLIDSNLENIHREFNEISNAIRKSVIVISEMNTHIETLVDSNKTQTDAIEESSISVNKVAETLEHMNNMAVERTQNALEMDNLIEAGDNKITLTNQMLTDINSKLDEVKGVVTIINNVASKTNLLSMNAAIESAHAGEAGKGFAVVAGQIRSLAEATQINSVRISEVIQNIVNSLSQANITSNEASVAFKKISTQSARIVSSLQEITSEIGEIDNQMQSIKTKSEETSITADQIDSYCTELKSKQQLVSSVVDSMNDLFVQTMVSIREIKKGTKDIVQRMREVSSSSKNSYKGMTDLENVLEEFKTKQAVQDAVQQADSESIIANVVSEELQNMSLMEDFVEPEDKEEIEFDLDSVTEYEG